MAPLPQQVKRIISTSDPRLIPTSQARTTNISTRLFQGHPLPNSRAQLTLPTTTLPPVSPISKLCLAVGVCPLKQTRLPSFYITLSHPQPQLTPGFANPFIATVLVARSLCCHQTIRGIDIFKAKLTYPTGSSYSLPVD